MKTKKIYLIVLLLTAIFSSCTKEPNDFFDKNATERVDERVNEIYSILKTKKKWIISYYPNSEKIYGGFTIFADFANDSDVTLSSDIDNNATKSSYSIIKDSGPVLSFNSYNKIIHYFSEPGADSGEGPEDTGMGGDFEFLVIDASEQLITLKGKKSGNIINMIPLDAANPQMTIDKYVEAAHNFEEMFKFNFILGSGDIFPLTLSYRTIKDASNPDSKVMPFRVTDTGLEFYNEEEFNGIKFKSLQFVEPTSQYPLGHYVDVTNSIKLVPQIVPIVEWFKMNTWSFAYSGVGGTGRTYWNTAKTSFANNRFTLDNVFIGNVSGLEGMMYYVQGATVGGIITHSITPVPNVANQVKIALVGSIYNLGGTAFGLTYWNAGLNQLTTPLNGRTFILTGVNQPEQPSVILLTDTAIPTNTFRLTLNEVNDPFNN